MSQSALLLTGRPGAGKTTVIRRVAEALAGETLHGFTTREIREGGARAGFALETFSGLSTVLAHVKIESHRKVGRYGVDVPALEASLEEALPPNAPGAIYLVDEIGKMECLSCQFVEAVRGLLDRGPPLVATVAARGGGFIEEVKERPDTELWTVTPSNRDELPRQVLAWLRQRRAAR